MPLFMMGKNDFGKIKKINGDEKQVRFLENLGFVRGTEFQVAQNNHGDMILIVKGVKVALGKDMAKKIIVDLI